MCDSRDMIEVWSREESFRFVNPFYIRFHYPSFLAAKCPSDYETELDEFEEKTRRMLKFNFEKFQARISEESGLLYEEDICKEVFDNTGPQELYSTHLFLYSNTYDIKKDWGFKIGGPYHLRSQQEKNLLDEAEELVKLESIVSDFRKKLLRHIFKVNASQVPSWTPEERKFLRVLSIFSMDQHQNGNVLNPFLPIVQELVKGICGDQLSDVHRILGSVLDVPDDVPMHQSGFKFSQKEVDAVPNRLIYDEKRIVIDRLALAIDSPETVDVDDAISAEQADMDTCWLHIHIADPSPLIPIGSPIDLQARHLTSSIYLCTGQIPMLPRSIGMASTLTPGKPNVTITFSCKVSGKGKILDYKVFPSIVTNLQRITYDRADKELVRVSEYSSQLKILKMVTDALLADRVERGHLSFEIPKPMVTINSDKSLSFKFDDKLSCPSAKIVAEAMIAAGRVAAEYSISHQIPVPFRYHPEPNEVPREVIENVRKSHSSSIFDRLLLLKCLQPSAVDLVPRPHWAMSLDAYCRSTSPLRRYLDLLLHHQLHRHLSGTLLITRNELSSIVTNVYRNEQYLKRLQAASLRNWVLRHVELRLEDGPLIYKALVLESSNKSSTLWIHNLAITIYNVFTIVSRLPGEEINVRVSRVDLLRQSLDLYIFH
jgi:exoribonuclease II